MRQKRTKPNDRDLEILRAYLRLGGKKTAKQCSCSRALIYQLRERFPETVAQLKLELERERAGEPPAATPATPAATPVIANASVALRTQADLSPVLARLAKAADLLKEARDPHLCDRIAKEAAVLEHAARLAKCDAIIAHAKAIRAEAERKLGELLNTMEKHPGGRPVKTGNRGEPVFATLADLRIPKRRSAQCQAIARMAERAPALYERLRHDPDFSRSAALSQLRKLEEADVDSEPETEPEREPAVMNVVVFGTTEDQWRKVMSYLGRLPRGAVFHCGTITAEQFRRWTRGSGPAPWEKEKEAETAEAPV